MLRLTVVVATYNRAESLVRCLESFRTQSAPREEWEVVVVNNNSKDDTEERFAEFVTANPDLPVRMVREERQGLSHARNCGMAAAQGHYIAIIDDDETVNGDFVRGYIDFFDSHPKVVAAGGRIVPCYEQGRPAWISPYTERPIANPLDLGDEVRPFGRGRCPGGGNMAVRREVIERYGAFDPALGRTGKRLIGGEETDFFNRLARSGEPFYYVPQSMIYHHISPDKLTRDYFTRLSHAIGVSEQIRTRQVGRYGRRLVSEAVKWAATLVLAVGYTLKFQWPKARYLVLMRAQITRGLCEKC